MTDRDSGRPPREPRRTDPVAGVPDGPEPPDGAGEEALRRLLRQTMEGIAHDPSAGTLDQLRHAVVTRRRRRRQLLFGAAASVALLGIGTPLVLSATGGAGGPNPRGTALGTDEGAVVDGTHEQGGDLDGPGPYPPDGLSSSSSEPRPDDSGPDSPQGGGGQEADGEDPWDLGVASPTCDRGQLGRVTTDTGTPDAQGRVYGSIRMVNVSPDACRVTGGDLFALPLGDSGLAAARVQVLDRTEGDRAPGLPAPDETREELVLPPGEAYEVRFAWVPSTGAARSCEVAAEPTADGGLSTDLGGGSEPGSTPTGDPTGNDPDGGDTGGDTGGPAAGGGSGEPAAGGGSGDTGSTQPTDPATGGGGEGDSGGAGGGSGDTGGTEPPVDGGGSGGGDPTPGGSGGGGDSSEGVLLRYTPAAGEPEAAQIRLQGSCSGTIYRTGVLEAPAV
ncbi:hypothetical protein [Streptomyces avicenniae]|uniref:hypothetical protein n=1 Tax=Streptomyces avicenniae TaxID=500153 RepID=UPI0006997F3F|nr:hypothetical protein [Streptomyces avicenniae]